jgi:hypothetical protein
MKRVASLLLLAALGGAGCVALPGWNNTPTPQEAAPAPPPPAVLPEEVNEGNARDKARALLAEIDDDDAHPPSVFITKPKDN